MKKRNFSKKLLLNKLTISNLSSNEKSKVYGGVNTTSPGDGATCIQSCNNDCLPGPKWDTLFCPTMYC